MYSDWKGSQVNPHHIAIRFNMHAGHFENTVFRALKFCERSSFWYPLQQTYPVVS